MNKTRNFEEAFLLIAELRAVARGNCAKKIKRLLGDSTNNNRTLTVSQVIRFLETNKLGRMANIVRGAYIVLEPNIIKGRRRTDAIDISELVNTYRVQAMDGRKLRRELGRVYSRVTNG